MGPTNRKPLRFNSFDSAVDSVVTAGTSSMVDGLACSAGANDQISSVRLPSSSIAARAFAMVALILARLRMIPASPIRRSTSASV